MKGRGADGHVRQSGDANVRTQQRLHRRAHRPGLVGGTGRD
jgi:hypothetical protein